MKKTLALMLVMVLCFGLAACGGGGNGGGAKVELTVVSSYGQEDGNRGNFETAFKAWETETGNTVRESSATADEAWKGQVLADFEAGSEPDVLFYFALADLDPLLSGDKVVALDEIRAEYPDYADNMDETKMPVSSDGKMYVVPTTGFWESLFCNDTVLAAAGVEAPGPDTTWDEFLVMCQKVKDAGYTPIACAINHIPHYWFEFLVSNAGGLDKHLTFPGDDPAVRQAWIDGLEGFKDLYDRGFFPENTLTATDDETMQLMAEDKAAFAGDGSWKVGWFENNADPDNITTTYVPGTNKRAATEIIGGVSMGYIITRKAWNDPAKRAAAVSFVEHMTSDEVVGLMSKTNLGTNALLKSPALGGFDNRVRETAYAMATGATAQVGAVQDRVAGTARDELFSSIQLIATGKMDAAEAVDKFIAAYGG